MELRQLEAFVAVAEERNFTRAAGRLFVAQSGLSATIRTLERDLGTPLFARTTRRVELTAAGEALLVEARRTLAAAHAAQDAVAEVQGVRRGTLSLGIMQTTWMFDLPGLLASYRARYPAIELRLQQASSADLGRMLRDRAVDIAFRSGAERSGRTLTVPLATSSLVVACTDGHPLSGRSAVALRTLADVALVGYPPGWGIRTLGDRALRANGLEPHYAFEGNDTQVLLDLVEAGLGAALLPQALAASRGPRLRAVAIRGRRWEWTISAQTLAPAPPSPAARALWDMLVDGG